MSERDLAEDRPAKREPIGVDVALVIRAEREGSSLIHDVNAALGAYRGWCDLGDAVPAKIWELGLRMLLGTRDVDKTRKWIRDELKMAGYDYKALQETR